MSLLLTLSLPPFHINLYSIVFEYREESKHNTELLKQDLYLEEWTDVYNKDEVNAAYNCLNNKLQYYYDKNIPIGKVKNKRNKPKSPWITKGLLKSIKTRNRLYKIHIRNPNEINLNTYKKYRNKLTKLIRLSRKLHFTDKLKKCEFKYPCNLENYQRGYG